MVQSKFDGRDVAAIEEFLAVVTAPDFQGPAPDTDAVDLVRSVIAHLREVESNPASSPVADHMAVYLAACVNTVLPDGLAVIPVVESAAAEAVRLAVAYMHDNLREDIDVADIAEAGFVSVRVLQLAFRSEMDTTPMAHLRALRLRAAHDELDAAHVGDGTTVTDVAIGWGFLHPGRFAQAYRKAYGQPPHTTLTS